MNFAYRITSINEDERWLFISSNDDDVNETDSFIFLLKEIANLLGTEIKEVGNMQYAFSNDPLKLTLQWDGLLGITAIYPNEVSKEMLYAFFKRVPSFN